MSDTTGTPEVKTPKKRGPKGPMTDQHKAALAQGRTEGRAVRNYMEALASQTPRRRGRKGRSADEIFQMLQDSTDPVERLGLRAQYRQAVLNESVESVDMEGLTAEFIKVAASYSERNGLTYNDWREEGVPASVLKEAGVRR